MCQLNKTTFFLLCMACVSWVTQAQTKPELVQRLVSTGMHTMQHPRKVDVIVIHSVFNPFGGSKYDLVRILASFKQYHVSAHYVIDRGGTIYQLVKERNIAYHAGQSRLPDGRTGINTFSIGIELITSDDEEDAPTDEQIQSLTYLVRDIKMRYPIKYVVRHSDIAPGRKTDPWNMDWEEFKRNL